ncbi:Hsp20/alpha crystallin family protein [Siminovitchia acidinfaciens]|uniref:Hsp20/alpha crystallin family protein n=1 Tax=Siminovitchia acidinfaciens TaxID=2321395 RepID=A0A429XV08_9BACI|nr:Hsp20/alpha crystallin family protein [Siminovitchia acidinfaciens]
MQLEFDKLKKWMEVTQKYQNGKFWDMVFDEHPPGETDLEEEDELEERPASLKYPQTDIFLTEQEVILLMEIPGAKKEDISLTVSGSRLVVRGDLQPPLINGVTVQNERLYGEFQREIDLPEPAESKNMMARFENGLLVISYPRSFIREENIIIR